MRYTVGIVGYGFVGESQAYAFAPIADIKVYDIDEKKCTHSLEDVLNQQFVFICLPTPMLENGKQDISLIDNFFKQIEYYDTPDTIFIIKSTVLPGTTDELLTTYWRKIVFCPEFLTEKNAKLDMLTQPRIILGGNRIWLSYVQELFEARFGNKHYILTDSTSAEIIKYMCNNFLSVKVSFVNEFYDLVETVGADWDSVIEGFVSDPRIGNSHTQTPGPDGKRGFGGTCFPKDINGMIEFSKDMEVDMDVLKSTWKTNLRVRPEQDWKELEGRAVTKKIKEDGKS